MRALRTALRAAGYIAAAIVLLLVVAVIVSQTAWFRDWLRRYAMREAEQFVNGQLVIGRVEGGLWGGVQLHDVRIAREGNTIVAFDLLELEYSLVDMIRQGLAIDQVTLVHPVVHLRRDGDTWNVATLLVEQPSDPDAPRATFRVDALTLRDGVVTIDDPGCPPSEAGCPPERIEGLRLEGRIASDPEGLDASIAEAALETSEPQLAVEHLAADLRLTDRALEVTSLELRTRASAFAGHATVGSLDTTPQVEADLSAEPLALTEVARFVPALGTTTLTPTIQLTAEGPLDALRVQLETRSDAGRIDADVVADAAEPGYAVDGRAQVTGLDVGAWIGDPARRTDLSATADVDVRGTDLASLTGTVQLDASRMQAEGYTVDALQATARIDEGVATLDAQGQAYGTALSSAGTVDLAGAAAGDPIQLDLRGRVAGLDVARLPASVGAPPLNTDVTLAYDVEGTPERLRVDATFARSRVDTLVIEAGSQATVRLDGGTVGYDVDTQVRDVDLQRLGEVLDVEALAQQQYASDLDGRIAVEGQGTSLASAVAHAEVQLVESTLGGTRIPQLTAVVDARRGAVDAQVSGRLEGLRPEALSGRSDLAGEVSGQFELAASLPDVTGELDPTAIDARVDLTLDRSEIAGLTIDGARVDASLTDGTGVVRTLQVQSPAVELAASGPVSLVEGQSSRVTFDLRVREAGPLASLAGVEGVAGSAQVQGVVEGPPDRLTSEGTLSLSDVVYDATASIEQAQGSYAVTVPDLQVAQAQGTVRLTATGVDAQDTQLDQVEVDARYADRVADVALDVTQQDLRAGLTGTVQITDEGQDVTLSRLEAQAPRLSWSLASGTTPQIRHADGRVAVDDLVLTSGPQQVALQGEVQLPAGDAPLRAEDVTVQATSVDLAPIAEQFVPDQQLTGTLDADLRFAGTVEAGTGGGTVTVRDAQVEGFAFESLSAIAEYADARAQLDATLRQNAASTLTVTGGVPVPVGDETDGRRLDLVIGGTGVDLAVLEGVTDQVEDVEGRLVVDARVTGTLDAPAVDGSLRVADGRLTVPRIRTTYEGINANVRVTPDRVQVEQLEVHDGDGHRLGVTGTLALQGTTPGDVALTATADEFRVFDNELGDVRLTADLKVAGTAEAPVIRGEVAVPSSLVDIDRFIAALEGIDEPALRNDQDFVYEPGVDAPIVAEAAASPPPEIDLNETDDPNRDDVADEPQAAPEGDPVAVAPDDPDAPAPQPTLIEAATIDVAIEVPNDLVVRGDDVRVNGGPSLGGLNITLGADLRATSDPGEPLIVTGTISTVRGYYDFQGRRFTLVRDSAIRFDGPEYTDPSLDLSATRDISGIEARILVTGTAQAPRLELSSTPSLDEADILALIVFNRPLDDLGSGEQVSLARRAGELVGGQLTSGLATSLRDAIGVDQFEIDAFGTSGPNVTLGNRLGERIYVRIRQQLGAQDLSQILLEYELLENLRLQTSVTQGGSTDRSPGQRVERSGIDLLYFFYY